MLKDERKTLRVDVRDEDDWKEHKDNWRTGNNRIPFKGPKWTGRTVFVKRIRKQYLSAPSVNMCNLRTIPLKEMFFVGYVSTAISEGRGVRSVTLIIERKNGIGNREYRFESNDEDFQLMGLTDKQAKEGEERGIVVMMREIPDSVPRMVLLCSEETNWFTIMNTKRQEKYGRREGTGGHQFVGNHHNNPWWPEFRLWFSQSIVIFEKRQGYYVLCRAMHWGVVVGTSE